MKPKKTEHEPQRELFRVELSLLVDAAPPLVKLAGRINWAGFEAQLAPTYHDKTGRHGLDTRLMVALHYLKYQHDLSDKAVVTGWVEIFGWAKTTGCFRKSRYRGVERTHAQGQYVVAACNLVRMAKLMVAAPPTAKRAVNRSGGRHRGARKHRKPAILTAALSYQPLHQRKCPLLQQPARGYCGAF